MQTKTALVIDDSRVARLTLSKLLQTHGFDIIEQGSAEEALQWLQQASSHPDIIFMDVMMPGTDGLTATRQIKSNQELAAIPVVICTGKETEADLEQALSTGAAAVLSKPPAADALNQLLADISAPAVAQASQPDDAVSASTAAISSEALLAEVRAQLLPELEQKLAASVSALQQQIKQQAADKNDSPGLDKLSEFSQQISDSLQQQFSELKQSFSSQAEQMVSATTGKAVESAMDNFGLTEKMMAVVRSEGMDWLSKQQAEMQETLQQQLKQESLAMLEQTLDGKLNEQVPALVKKQQEMLQQELNAQQQSEIKAFKSQLGMQRNIAIAAVGVAVLALILALV